jgi:hypothetical protein
MDHRDGVVLLCRIEDRDGGVRAMLKRLKG